MELVMLACDMGYYEAYICVGRTMIADIMARAWNTISTFLPCMVFGWGVVGHMSWNVRKTSISIFTRHHHWWSSIIVTYRHHPDNTKSEMIPHNFREGKSYDASRHVRTTVFLLVVCTWIDNQCNKCKWIAAAHVGGYRCIEKGMQVE